MMLRFSKLALAVAAFVAIGLAAAETKAVPVIVLNRSDLQANNTIDFQSQTANTSYSSSLTIGAVNFAYTLAPVPTCSSCGVGVVTGSNFGLAAGNNALFVNAAAGQIGIDTLKLTFTSPVRNFGFDIKASNNVQTPNAANPAQYRVTVRDVNGQETTFLVNNTDFNTFSFFGFTSDVDISEVRVAMMTLGGQPVIDNVSTNAETVPEPTTMLLFGTGVAGLASLARRRRKSAHVGGDGCAA